MGINAVRLFNDADLRALIAKMFLPNIMPVFEGNTQFNTTRLKRYVVVTKPTSTPIGTSVRFDGDTETEYSTTRRESLYSITIVGLGAKEWADRFQPSWRLSSTVNELKKLGIGSLQMSSIRNLSGAFDSGYEERAQFDLLISVSTTVKSQLNAVNSVELDSGLHIEQ